MRLGMLAAALLATTALGTTPAAASNSRVAQTLRAIVRRDGRSAKASPIVRPHGIATALVFHAVHVTVTDGYVASSHSLADIYRFTKGNWHHVAGIDFGKNSLGTDLQAPPKHVELTGATDFVVSFETAGHAPIAVVSDAGGHWRAVPFVQPGQPAEIVVEDGQVSGGLVISQTRNCTPSCVPAKTTRTTWRYNAAARAFEPYTPPTGPCSDQTLTSQSMPDMQAVGCFSGPADGVYSTKTTFKINGVQFAPDPGTTLTFDPGNPRMAVAASGPGCVQALVTLVVKLGELDLACWRQSATIAFSDNKLVLNSLFASSPAGNFFGLSFAYSAITLQSGGAALIQGSVGLAPLYGNPLANASFSGTTTNAAGLTVSQTCIRINPGTFGWSLMKFGIGGAEFPLRTASLCYYPGIQEFAGSATIALPNDPPPLPEPTRSSPAFKATLAIHVGPLPAPGSLTIPGTHVKVSFAGLEVGLQGINEEVYPFIYLQQLAAGVSIYPNLQLEGEIGFSLLPQENQLDLGQGIALLEAVGSGQVTFGGNDGFSDFFFANNPDNYVADTSTPGSDTINVDGKLYLGGTNYSALATLATAHATIETHGKSTFNGDVFLGGIPLLPSLQGSVKGEILGNHYAASGGASWTEFGSPVASGHMLVSDRGVAGCATVQALSDVLGSLDPLAGYLAGNTEIGFKDEHGQGLSFFPGCSFGNLSTIAAITEASTTRVIKVPRGRKVEMIAVRGTTGPPAALVSGPGNRAISAPPQRNRFAASDGSLVLADTADDTTYYIVGKPKPGRWTITPAEGASPIASIAVAGELGPAGIRARVSGSGQHRRLSWHFNRAAGRTVLFVDSGKNVSRLITATSRASGRASFHPLAAGPAGRRRILAIVEQDGAPRTQTFVARYSASPPTRLGSIRGLRVRRRGRRVSISWDRVSGAQAYFLTVSFGHHESADYALGARKRSETITTTLAGRATIFASASERMPGRSRSERFKRGRRR